jgi:hypothetical protein
MGKFWVVLAVSEDGDGDLIVDNDRNDCLEETFYDQKAAEAKAREDAAALEQTHVVVQAVAAFSPQKRPIKRTTLK